HPGADFAAAPSLPASLRPVGTAQARNHCDPATQRDVNPGIPDPDQSPPLPPARLNLKTEPRTGTRGKGFFSRATHIEREQSMADAAIHGHGEHDTRGFFTRWFMSTNHKDIGILYLFTAGLVGLISVAFT